MTGPWAAHLCAACGLPQPLGSSPESRDPFAALSAPKKFSQDPAVLQRRFLELSRQLHPDRFARSSPEARQYSLERMSLLNDALGLLRNRDLIREQLWREAGMDGASAARQPADLSLAEKWFDLQEQALESENPKQVLDSVLQFTAEVTERLGSVATELRRFEDEFDTLVDGDLRRVEVLKRMEQVTRDSATLKSMLRDVERLKARLGMG